MPQTIESYLDTVPLPKAAKADAWEAYQASDHDSFKSSLDKLNVPQNVKADMYEMRFGNNSQPAPAQAGPPSMIDNIENMAGKAASYVKNLASRPVPLVDAQDREQFPKSSALFQKVADFAGKPLLPSSVSNYVSDVSKHASTIPGNPTATAALQGIDRGAGKMAEGLTTPTNIGMLGATLIPGVGEAAALGFGLQGLVGAGKDAYAAKQAYNQGDVGSTAEHLTSGALNTGMSFLGLKGLIHDEAPPANTQSPGSPSEEVRDRNLLRNESVAPLQDQPLPQSTHSVPSAENDALISGKSNQLDLNFHPGQGDLFAAHGSDSSTPSTLDLNQPLLNPAQGSSFAVQGETLPPQMGVAGPMSPEAEATSKTAQESVSPQAPQSPTTEGLTGSDQVSKLEDSIRTQTGQVMRLNQLVKGNQVHAALERGIDETRSALDPQARNVGPGLAPEDQKLLSIAMGEKVGSVLTPDQMDKAYALRGKVMSEKPELQYRGTASKDRLAKSRVEMAREMATTDDPELKAKLQDALQPDESGKLKPFLYEPARKTAPAVDLDPDHPEAPFASKTFGATHPDISLDNLETALGQRPRSVDMGLGDPELKAQLKAVKAAPTVEGAGTVKANADGFGYDNPNNPKGITGDAKLLTNQILEGAVRAKSGQIASQLRDDVKAYQNLRDSSQSSPLIEQLKKLSTLPKEVRELVKSPKPETSETNASAATRIGTKAAEARNTPPPSKAPSIGTIQKGIGKTVDSIAAQHPENLGHVQTLVQIAAEHFGHDTDGAMVATHNALKVLKQGIEQDDPWAMRNAIKEIRRQTPHGDLEFRNAGVTPKDVKESAENLKNYFSPQIKPDDRIVSADFAAEAYLRRYEKMDPLNRSAYSSDIWSDETERTIREGDPDGTNGYRERYQALRESIAPVDFYSRVKGLIDSKQARDMAHDAKRDIQSINGHRAGYDLQMRDKFNKFSADMDQWSNYEARQFIHREQNGLDQEDGFKNQMVGVVRKSLDEARDRITAVNGDFKEYLLHYFPQIWANVGKGVEHSEGMVSRLPAGASPDFLKSRENEFFNDGIREGMSPISYNPLKLTMMRVEQMNLYAMKEEIAQKFIDSNKAVLIKSGEPVPEGFTALDDPAFQRRAEGGKFYSPSPVAKVFNNFTSRGLNGKLRIPLTQFSAYDAFRAANNTLNQFQLGMSMFHGSMSFANSFMSDLSRGMMIGANGLFRGDGTAMADGMKAILKTVNVPQKWILGRNFIAHLKNPDTFQELSSIREAFYRAGGRVGVDKLVGTAYADKFKRAYNDALDEALTNTAGKKALAWGRVAANGIGRVMEWSSKPIMEKIVPTLKIATAAMHFHDILAASENESYDTTTDKLQRAWDNLDDRFGQVVYDNYFMSKITRDIAQTTVRSPGWQMGSGRLGAGGLLDLAKSFKDASKGQRFQISDRTAYLGALLATTMAVNGLLTWYHTGEMPHGIDYFYHRLGTFDANGEANRAYPKTYIYDFIGLATHPIDTVLHKISSLIGTATDLYANKTYWGEQIADPGSSVGARLAQQALFTAKQYGPFTLSNYLQARSRGGDAVGSFLQSSLGILPAPKWAGRSAAENLAGEYHAESIGQGGMSEEKYEREAKYTKLQADIRNGKVTSDELTKRVEAGEIPVSFVDHIYDKQQAPNLERWTKPLDATQAMHVFDRATPEEKQRLLPIMLQKLDKLDPQDMQAYADKLEASQHHPDTHVFSQSKFAAANPGADHGAAAAQAQQKGYEIHP